MFIRTLEEKGIHARCFFCFFLPVLVLPGALDEQEGFYTNSHGENDCWHHAWLLQWLLWTQRCHHQCHHRPSHKWFLPYLASLRLLKQDAATPVSYGEPWPSGRSWRRCGPQCQQMAPKNHPDEKKGRNKTWAECGIVWPLLSFGEAIALINYIQDGVCGA